MTTESDEASGADPEPTGGRTGAPRSGYVSRKSRQRRTLWICLLGWTAFVGVALWWLFKEDGGLSVWVFQERDLNRPAFAEKLQSIFRGELGLQRTYPWILFAPFLVLMAWHFPLEREHLRRNLPLHLAACIAFAWACQTLNFRTNVTRPKFLMVHPEPGGVPGPPPSETDELAPARPIPDGERWSDEPMEFRRLPRPLLPAGPRRLSVRSIVLDVLAYGAIAGLVHSVNFYGRLRERERRALFLESNLANARLNTLKVQLQPHFLFNSLNAIAALLRRDPRLAESTLVSLSELLRLALSQSEQQEVALRDELDFVRRYLEIQQIRFGDKLRVEQQIAAETLACLVPTLALQPLVENAIRHGIEPADKAGKVRVSASREQGKLVLVVEDDGVGLRNEPGSGAAGSSIYRSQPPGVSAATKAGTGIGLANLRERLQALYGADGKLELRARAGGGVMVRVEIPWRRGPSAESGNN